jgi:hypothetical protein
VVQVRKALAKNEALQLTDPLTRTGAQSDRERIERYIKWFVGADFSVRWRFFVRAQNVKALEEQLQHAQQTTATVTALEDVFEKLKNVMP